jgi:hypothetical protein
VAGGLTCQSDVLFPFTRDKAFRVYDVQGGQVFSISGDLAGAGAMYYGAVEQGKHVANKEYVDTRLKRTGGTTQKMEGILYLGGNKIAGVGDPDAETDAANRKYVDEKIDAIEISGPELSTKDKLYLQGFYPFRVSEGSSTGVPGEVLFKDQNYLADVNPESWKYIYFSVVDAYGQGQVGKFMNHMQMKKFHQGQMWFVKENGFKICSYIGMMKARDTNFESSYSVEMDNDREMVVSEYYDVAPLRIDKGEVIWIKCSFWG